MNPELNSEFEEVLLTAYLDDEVTDEERALVEKQLRTSESSRKLLEELRSVRDLVVQLRMTQPSRSFQQGPWNDNRETVASSQVVLNDHRSGWNKSFQRLASLAALIAVGVGVSVLLFGPKWSTMAMTENAKAPLGAGGTVLGNAQAPAAVPKSTPSELDFLLPLIQKEADADWLAVDGRMESATIVDKEDRDLALKEAEASPKISPPQARYIFRFQGTVSDQGKGSFDGLDIAKKRYAAVAANELRLRSTKKEIDEAANPILIELQISSDNWASGSERLRQMGFDVPLELPQTEYLDFTAIQIPKDASGLGTTTDIAVNPLETDVKQSNATPAIGWVLRRIDLSRNPLDSKQASVTNAGSKNEQLGTQPEGQTRIRVRAMKKE
ncbi:MAG: zf-HC2 domain-containing protein [Planctomycetota bacterium]|nr:zf-HC2 domain-containing protein [Planctomycetota bacterium]